MGEAEARLKALRLAPGVRVVSLEDGIAFVADHLRMRLSGPVAQFIEQRLAPLLDGSRDRTAIAAALPDIDPSELGGWLDRLVDAGALDERTSEANAEGFLAALQLEDAAIEHLRARRIAIVGTQDADRLLADELAKVGLNEVAAVPPENAPLVASKDELAEHLRGCDLAVHTGGTGRLQSAHWLNQIALETPLRALFARIEGQRASVGPLVLPGEGPCFLCWRMRELANADDYETAMAWETAAAASEQPDQPQGAGFPMLAPLIASVAAAEIVKVLAAFGLPVTAGRVWEFDALSLETHLRPVLQRPDCPACRKKAHPPPQPPIGELRGAAVSPDNLTQLRPRLVDERAGIVRRLSRIPRDPTEPDRPIVVRAELSNHHFLARDQEPFTIASGKGMKQSAAETSALGEALERYGAAQWDLHQIVRARARDLDLPAVTPEALVLYADEQYAQLKYERWREDARIGWVEARRVHDNERVFVPALGTFLDYAATEPGEYLCQVTSNGLAAGPSLASAILSGLYEVLERDAFMIGWLRRRPGVKVDADTARDPTLIDLARAYGRRGVELHLVLLETDHSVFVCAAFGVDSNSATDRPAVVVGLGADLDWRAAARRAALEVGQVRPALRARLRNPDTRRRLAELLADPMQVADLEDHDLLYADVSQLHHLGHWLDSPSGDPEPGPRTDDAAMTLESIARELAASGTDIVYVNLTPADLESLGVSVVRVHVPGFQPIHFGAYEARLGGDRVWTYGGRRGAAVERDLATLNLQPHPLA